MDIMANGVSMKASVRHSPIIVGEATQLPVGRTVRAKELELEGSPLELLALPDHRRHRVCRAVAGPAGLRRLR